MKTFQTISSYDDSNKEKKTLVIISIFFYNIYHIEMINIIQPLALILQIFTSDIRQMIFILFVFFLT